MSKMTAKKITYDFSPEQLTKLIAADMGMPDHQIRIEFLNDFSDEYSKTKTVTGIRVHVDNVCAVL